jgi:hypothetical protein
MYPLKLKRLRLTTTLSISDSSLSSEKVEVFLNYDNGKDKIILVLLAEHNAMKTYWGVQV